MQDISELIERHLIEMFTIAGEYCIYIENSEQVDKNSLLTFFCKIGPILYLRGSLFPLTDQPDEDGGERVVTGEQWETIFNALRNKLGTDDLFNYLEYQSPNQDEIVKGSLSEIITDVYQDMKDFMWLMTKNTTVSRKFAAFEIKQLFLSNWGPKLLLAQNILHSRLLLPVSPDEDSEFA